MTVTKSQNGDQYGHVSKMSEIVNSQVCPVWGKLGVLTGVQLFHDLLAMSAFNSAVSSVWGELGQVGAVCAGPLEVIHFCHNFFLKFVKFACFSRINLHSDNMGLCRRKLVVKLKKNRVFINVRL